MGREGNHNYAVPRAECPANRPGRPHHLPLFLPTPTPATGSNLGLKAWDLRFGVAGEGHGVWGFGLG